MSSEAAVSAVAGYPLRYDVQYPEELSRWLIFIKWLLAFPHFIILYALGIAARVIGVTTFFPRRGLSRDESPPFSWEPGKYAVPYEVDYPQELNRWLPLLKWLLAIP